MILHAHEGKARREADEWAATYRALVHVLKRTDLKRPLYVASIDGRVPELGEWESILEVDGRIGDPVHRHAGPRPHGVGCHTCREERLCNECGAETTMRTGRCVNGRCRDCCPRVCRHREF